MNRMNIINDDPEYNWLNLSKESFKLKCKQLSPQWFFTVYSEIYMMLEISGYMDLFFWGLPAANGG